MNTQEYLDTIEEAMDVVVAKGEDYNSSGVELEEYFPFGDWSYTQMLHLKVTRLRSLLNVEEPNFDSRKDTLIDLINYAVFYLSYLQNAEGELDE